MVGPTVHHSVHGHSGMAPGSRPPTATTPCDFCPQYLRFRHRVDVRIAGTAPLSTPLSGSRVRCHYRPPVAENGFRPPSLSTWAGTCASCRASVGGWEPVDIAAMLDQGIEPVTSDGARRTATGWVVICSDMGLPMNMCRTNVIGCLQLISNIHVSQNVKHQSSEAGARCGQGRPTAGHCRSRKAATHHHDRSRSAPAALNGNSSLQAARPDCGPYGSR